MLSKCIGAIAFAAIVGLSSGLVAQEMGDGNLPLSNSSSSQYVVKPMTLAQQAARFEADQRMMRMEWNKWIGYSPLRPTVNSSYMSNGVQRFYVPSRGIIVSSYTSRSWYW